ncbi:hypothetical protein JCM16138_09470 [Thermococcus atlanticus]
MSFTVKVKSTYSTGQNAGLELYIDGNAVDTVKGVINANSEETLNLHWIARQGEHSYTIKAYSLVGGEKFTEDEKNGDIVVQLNGNDEVCGYGDYWISWLDVMPTLVVGDGKVHVKVKATYCQPLPDVGGGRIPLLDLKGNVYVDDQKVSSFNTLDAGKSLSVGETGVIDEFDWPLSAGNHTILLKVRNLSGLQEDIKNETDKITVEMLPHNEYPLKLTDISCNDIKFNFEASNYYTRGGYVSPLECTLNFKNVENAPVYVTELSTDLSVSPPDLEEAIPDHKTVSVNENINPGEVIPIQIQSKATTTDRQMLLRVDGTTATLYIDYTIEGMINGANEIAGKGVAKMDISVSVYQGTVYTDVIGDVVIFIAGPKAEEGIVTKIPIITKLTKIPGGKQILGFLSLEPFKNAIVYGIDKLFGG